MRRFLENISRRSNFTVQSVIGFSLPRDREIRRALASIPRLDPRLVHSFSFLSKPGTFRPLFGCEFFFFSLEACCNSCNISGNNVQYVGGGSLRDRTFNQPFFASYRTDRWIVLSLPSLVRVPISIASVENCVRAKTPRCRLVVRARGDYATAHNALETNRSVGSASMRLERGLYVYISLFSRVVKCTSRVCVTTHLRTHASISQSRRR